MSTSKSSLHIAVIGFALVTSFLTALANLVVENMFGINVFSIGFWIILPAGALIIGAAGASGGLLACRYFHVKPNKLDALALIAIAALTMWLIYYLGFITMVLDDGRKVADYVSFSDYVDVVTTKSHMRVGRGAGTDTGEMGNFGYFKLAIEFVGVLLGGFAVFATLKSMAMCDVCNVYYKKIASKESALMNAIQAESVFGDLKSGDIDRYKTALAATYSDLSKDENKIKFKFTLMRCPKCKDEFIKEECFAIGSNGNAKELTDFGGRTNLPKESAFELEFKK
jgi:hypothetical protein